MNFHTISAPAHSNIEPDLSARFFKQLGGSDFTFQTFCDNKTNPDRTLVRVIPSVNVDLLNQLHAQGAGVYITVNETDGKGRRTTESIVRVRAVWQEDDDGYAGEFPLAPSMVIELSPGHFHRYWIVVGRLASRRKWQGRLRQCHEAHGRELRLRQECQGPAAGAARSRLSEPQERCAASGADRRPQRQALHQSGNLRSVSASGGEEREGSGAVHRRRAARQTPIASAMRSSISIMITAIRGCASAWL